jgi:tripartite ATP-independent transporter DctM subunit
MILYGAFVEESIGQLFIGGIIPGMLLVLIFMGYIATISTLRPHLAPKEGKVTWNARLEGAVNMLPIVLLIFIVLGGIYAGVMTPTESAAIGSTSAILIALAYRRLNFRVLRKSLVNTIQTSCMIFFIAIGAQILAYSLSILRIPVMLAEWVLSLQISPLMVLISVYFLYLILGCFLDGIAMMLITLPVVYPLIVKGLGFDGIWFGIVMVILIEIGGITPPVGLNLFVIHGLAKHHSMVKVITGIIPFILIMAVILSLITAFPNIVLWLPAQMSGSP